MNASSILCGQRTTFLKGLYAFYATESANWNDWTFDLHKNSFLTYVGAQKPYVLPKRGKGEELGRASTTTTDRNSMGSSYSVLVPLCITNGVPTMLFTLRSTNLAKHRGEISFPGGRADSGDADLTETALRETEEEIGLSRDKVNVWTSFPPMPTGDGKGSLSSVVGYVGHLAPSTLYANPREVDVIFFCRMQDLCNSNNAGYTTFRTRQGLRLPVFLVKDLDGRDRRIWGMTAVILLNVLRGFVPNYCPEHMKQVKTIH